MNEADRELPQPIMKPTGCYEGNHTFTSYGPLREGTRCHCGKERYPIPPPPLPRSEKPPRET